MTEDLGPYDSVRPHPLLGVARHGALGPGPVQALLDARDVSLLHALATNSALDVEVRDLVIDVACSSTRPVSSHLTDPRTALARQPGLTADQRRRLATSTRLPDDALAALVVGGPADGVDEAVVAHLDRLDARVAEVVEAGEGNHVAALAALKADGPGPVIRAASVSPGFDHLRRRLLPLLDDVSDFLAGLDPDRTEVDAVELVAGLPFAPPNFARGMAGMLRWPGAAEVVDPRSITGLVVVAAVAADRAIHRKALAEAHRRLASRRTTDAEKLANSLATNPSVRQAEVDELVGLRELLVGGYLHSWFPIPGDGLRADQVASEADRRRLLRIVAARPELSRRGVWSAAAIAMTCETDEVRAQAIGLMRANRREGLDGESLAWVAGRLGTGPDELTHPERNWYWQGPGTTVPARGSAVRETGRAATAGAEKGARPLRPSEVGRLEAEQLLGDLGESRDAWAVLEVVCRDNPDHDLPQLAGAARAIAGLEPRPRWGRRRRGAA